MRILHGSGCVISPVSRMSRSHSFLFHLFSPQIAFGFCCRMKRILERPQPLSPAAGERGVLLMLLKVQVQLGEAGDKGIGRVLEARVEVVESLARNKRGE